MKKNVKSVLAKAMAVVMALSITAIAPAASSDAASKKPTLAKKLSVNVGKTKTLKVKGKAKVKSTKWSLTKKGKKIISISSKKKKSVKVKGKKAGKATLTAKIKVGKKTYKKKCTVTVKKADNKTTPTPTPTPTPPQNTGGSNATPTPVGKVNIVDGRKVIESSTHSIAINELNETTLTCVSKRPEDADEVALYTTYGKNGVTFTSGGDYNSGVSFYVNPCTNASELEELPKGDEYLGFRNAEKDMSDFDYIRIELTSENEMNFRTYNGYDTLESEGFPGTCTTETYEAKWVGPVAADEYLVEDGGTGKMVKEEYHTRTVFIPIADLYSGKGSEAGSGCDLSNITAIAISPQREGMEVTIHSIDFVKVERPNKVSSINVTCEKTSVANNKTASLVATVGPENASRKIVKWASSDESLATIDFQGTILANNQDKTGDCTFTATATDGSGVTGSITLKIGDDSGPQIIETQKVDFTDANVTASEGAEKSANGIKFKAGANQTFVNFGKYMDAKNIDLSKYDSLKVEWEVQDADGKVLEDYSAYGDDAPTNGKIAFAASSSLNGYSNGVDTSYQGDDDTDKDQMYISYFTGDTNILTISNLNPTDVPTIAGFNLQLTEKIPATCHIVVKAVTFVKD